VNYPKYHLDSCSVLKLSLQHLFLILSALLINPAIAVLITPYCKLYPNQERDKATIKNAIRKSSNPSKLDLPFIFFIRKMYQPKWTDTL